MKICICIVFLYIAILTIKYLSLYMDKSCQKIELTPKILYIMQKWIHYSQDALLRSLNRLRMKIFMAKSWINSAKTPLVKENERIRERVRKWEWESEKEGTRVLEMWERKCVCERERANVRVRREFLLQSLVMKKVPNIIGSYGYNRIYLRNTI